MMNEEDIFSESANRRDINIEEKKAKQESIRQDLYEELESDDFAFRNESTIYNKYETSKIFNISSDNVIINDGNLNGDIYQNSYVTKHIREQQEFNFYDKDDIKKFVALYYGTNMFAALAVIAILETVPEYLLYTLIQKLNDKLSPLFGEKVSSNSYLHMSDPLDKIIETLKIEKKSFIYLNNNIQDEISCLVLSDERLNHIICEELWNNYIQFRQAFIEWLFLLRTEDTVVDMLAFEILNGVYKLSSYDFTYTNLNIIPKLTDGSNYGNNAFLVRILKYFIGIEAQKSNIDSILCNLLYSKNKYTWNVAYFLFNSDASYQYNRLVKKHLQKLFQSDLEQGIEQNNTIIYTKYCSVNFYPAYKNKLFAGLIIETICNMFSKCKTYLLKYRFGFFFCYLFLQDLKAKNITKSNMIFIECFNSRDLKKEIQPLLKFVWEKRKLRILLCRALEKLISGLDKGKQSWEYMKPFWKALAFTYSKEDYDNTIQFLEQLTIKRNDTAKQVLIWLESLLKQNIENQKGELV